MAQPRPAFPSSDAASPAEPARVGRMIIDLIPSESGTYVTPIVHFDPVGRFTPGTIFNFATHFAQEIERAHAQVRAEQRQKEKAA